MSLSHLPAFVSACFAAGGSALDKRSAMRLPLLLLGALLAKGRRTVTAWFRAAGITDDFRCYYNTLWAVGRRGPFVAACLFCRVVKPLLLMCSSDHLIFAIDDSPTKRYGPCIQGAGLHHNPTRGPAGEKFLYGHLWVTLAWLGQHPFCGVLALPLQALVYIRAQDVVDLNKEYPEYRWTFRTKLELAVELVLWLLCWLGQTAKSIWVVVDGGYAKRPFLRPLLERGLTVFGRLRKDAGLRSLPSGQRRQGQRGPLPTYGKQSISLAKRAGQQRGWQEVTCTQYGRQVTKTVKVFPATWEPVGGAILVVLVKEEDGWLAFFCTDVNVSVAAVLETMAARGAIEQTFKDVKEVWGAQQQQLRNVYACIGAFNVNLWMYSLVEVWAWSTDEDVLTDRRASPWDSEPRRPSHADKRKALQREVLQSEIETALAGRPTKGDLRALAQRLLDLAA
jgi:DDE superfamily endonuclease